MTFDINLSFYHNHQEHVKDKILKLWNHWTEKVVVVPVVVVGVTRPLQYLYKEKNTCTMESKKKGGVGGSGNWLANFVHP